MDGVCNVVAAKAAGSELTVDVVRSVVAYSTVVVVEFVDAGALEG